MNPTLNYHRRHGRDCDGKHAAGTYTSEPEERKKNHKRCHCPIYASGSLQYVAKRYATKRTEWSEAADLMAPYLAANSWEPTGIIPPPRRPTEGGMASVGSDGEAVPKRPSGKRCLIENAISMFLAEHRQAQSSPNTQRTYRYTLGEATEKTPLGAECLKKYSDDLGLRYVHEWEEPGLVRQYRASWHVTPLTATKKLGHLKTFFEFCLENGWVTHNPARIKSRRNQTDPSELQQRQPYTDDDLARMYEGCRDFGNSVMREWPKKKDGRQVLEISMARQYNRKWTGVDLADFIALSVHTGLRISDVATFHIDRLQEDGRIHIRTIKSQGNTKVCTWAPAWLVDRIRARGKEFGPLIFGAHTTTDINAITDGWRKRLKRLWAECGEWKLQPLPHRFRHTFARILLQDGRSVAVVADLLGNTEAIVRKHYKFEVQELQDATAARLRGAFANTPRPDQPRRAKVKAIG